MNWGLAINSPFPSGIYSRAGLYLVLLVLVGCLQGTQGGSSVASRGAQGRITGGQQPVADARVYLLAAGATGSTSLLVAGRPGVLTDSAGRTYVTSAADGTFSFTTLYDACADPTVETYALAIGGNPGLTAGTSNTAISLAAALGPCSTLTPTRFLNLNELTTVAFTGAFAPYLTDAFHLTTAAAISDAASAASALVSTTTGAPSSTARSTTLPVAKLNTLANALAACVNSSSSASTTCQSLFSASAGSDTFAAALAIAQAPAANVPALFSLGSSSSPFQPTLTSAPPDWTLAPSIPATIQTVSGLTVLGDSISTIGSGNRATPSSLGYAQLLANTLGSPFDDTNAQGGDESIDMASKAWLNALPKASGNPPIVMMIGTNDVLFEDSGTPNDPHRQAYRDLVLGAITLWLTPPANKLITGNNTACTSPGWGLDGSFPGSQNGLGLFTTTIGATASCTYTSYGDPIFLWHTVTQLTGSAAVTIDGSACGTYTTEYANYAGSHNQVYNTIAALRCPAAAGTHVVTVTMLSGQQIGFQGLGTATFAPVAVAAPSRMTVWGPLHYNNDASAANTFAYAKMLENLSTQLAADGYLVQYINVRDHFTYNGTLDGNNTAAPGTSCMTDQLHPNNCGHAQIASSLSSTVR